MARKSKEVSIEIPQIQLQKAKIRIVGDTPLIVKAFSQKAKEELSEAQQKKAKKTAKGENIWESFIDSLHWITSKPTEYTEEAFNEAIGKGARFGFPSTGIKECITSGAYRKKLVKDKVTMYSAFHIDGELCEIKGDINMREDYARNPMSGGAVIVTRPEFTNWEIEFTIRYDNTFSLEQLINFINLGGFGCGIGCWRVEKGGQFGMFHVA